MKALPRFRIIIGVLTSIFVLSLPAFSQEETKRMPANFDVARTDVVHGTTENVTYQSKTFGTTRKATVYLPPHYYKTNNYPVLYLLPDSGDDEKRWVNEGRINIIMDNLYELQKVSPMVIVMPDGRAARDGKNATPEEKAALASLIEKDAHVDLIPFIEKNYAVQTDWQMRAIAGIGSGGANALNISLANPKQFDWTAAFSAAKNVKAPETLIPGEQRAAGFIWLSCGNDDDLLTYSKRTHEYFAEKNIPHVYYIQPGKHDFNVWKNNFYLFSQWLFRPHTIESLARIVYQE